MSENNPCACTEAFGQPLWSPECPVHERCAGTMRGITIQCVLTTGHRGLHL